MSSRSGRFAYDRLYAHPINTNPGIPDVLLRSAMLARSTLTVRNSCLLPVTCIQRDQEITLGTPMNIRVETETIERYKTAGSRWKAYVQYGERRRARARARVHG
jgi:hypothetical protein